ncbi:MAG: hypothetical protein P9L94_04025 [Candidatus Hinthialibacter antarcticus]|nr:hypothetical protein [Candidatus Hinthialibacter antarcticus]
MFFRIQKYLLHFHAVLFLCLFYAHHAAALDLPDHEFASLQKHFETYDVILRPDKLEPEWWAGAPSVVRGEDGVFWLACRMRSAEFPRGLRGYEIRILRSDDGVHFEKALSILAEDLPMKGFERPALLRDPHTKKWKLYACGPWQGGPWSIIKFDDAERPDQFDPSTARVVISPIKKEYERDVIPVEYKDPVIAYADGAYHAYLIGYMRRNERIYHFSSGDGETWAPVGDPHQSVMQLIGWHDFFVRPSSLLPIGAGWLFVYEGSSVNWFDPVYNVQTGLAFTFDLHRMIDLTPDAPLLKSSTPNQHFSTFRYSHWLEVGDELWVYAEVAAEDETHEIRLFRLPEIR